MWGYGPHSGMMYGGYGYGYGVLHMVFWAVILIGIIVGIVWMVRTMMASAGTRGASAPRSAGLAVLEERYARGEINRDEYLQKKGDLHG
jgi:putative membrane protein